MNMRNHAVADIFPLMSGSELESLCADIREHGLRDPIWTFENKIIDGRNRYTACGRAGVEPRFREYEGDQAKLVSFVVSLNLHRRHLSESQRAMVAAKIANLKDGQRAASIEAPVTQNEAAEMLNVSRASVQRAEKVQQDGVPELVEKVEAGEMSVSHAAQIASFSKGKQKRLIRRGRQSGQKLLTKLKISSLKRIQGNDAGCLVCNPEAEASKETVSAFMQLLAKRHPSYRVYFQAVVDELEELELSSDTLEAQEKIIAAIGMGYQTRAEIQNKTKIENALLDHALAVLLDYSQIYAVDQGGKTDGARGARKTLYKLTEQPEFEPEEEYEEEMI